VIVCCMAGQTLAWIIMEQHQTWERMNQIIKRLFITIFSNIRDI